MNVTAVKLCSLATLIVVSMAGWNFTAVSCVSRGGVLGAPAPPLRHRFKLAYIVRKTYYAILTVPSFYSETARSNRTVKASARIRARVWYYRLYSTY